ncbi:MAG TPA: ComEC/Rec2 family competence protein [Virgibacillus sp.]|nr:ComEC/Rec2 family competence protein [Virgibacillus sp.]
MRTHHKRVILILFLSMLISTSFSVVEATDENSMKIHFIDVGQGDSMLIQTPTDKNILIDGGPPEAGKKVVAYLKKHDIDQLDLLFATHPDIDHIGGLLYVMKTMPIQLIIDSGKLHTTKTYRQYLHEISMQKIPIHTAKESEMIRIDEDVDIQILNTYEHFKSSNQSSIVVKASYKDMSFLFLGDVEVAQEKALMKKYSVQADVVKVAHHGSKSSSSLPFLQAVNPSVAILTYLKNNDYGHPVPKVIKNLNQVNAQIYSTAVFGDLIIQTNGEGYFILPSKSPAEGIIEKQAE